MMKKLKTFINDQTGAVTVDWVVLTAAIMGLNVFFIMGIIETGLNTAGDQIADKLEESHTSFGSSGGGGGDDG